MEFKEEIMDEQFKNDTREDAPKVQSVLSEEKAQSAPTNSDSKANQSKKFYQKWWFWLIIAIVVLAAIGSVAGGTSATDGNGTTQGSDKEEKYYVGDTVSSGNLYVTINSVRESKYVNGVTTDNLFIILSITVENRGNKSDSYKQNCFKLKNGDAVYEISNVGINLPNGYWLQLEVGPGLKRNTELVYEIPRSYVYDNYYLEVVEGFLSAAAKIYLLNESEQ